jgi:hypothetical protein
LLKQLKSAFDHPAVRRMRSSNPLSVKRLPHPPSSRNNLVELYL